MSAFPLRMALRELRAGWNHVSYFIICIALGVGSIVGVASLSENLGDAVQHDARSLMAADVEISTRRALSQQNIVFLNTFHDQNIHWIHIYEMLAMASDSDARDTQLVELKAIQDGYPFYGALKTIPARPLTTLLGSQPNDDDRFGVLVQEALLLKLDLAVGDDLLVGHAHFVITGTIQREPDRIAGAFSLGPRVMISRAGLDAAQLIQPGSRVRHRYLFKIPPTTTPETVKETLRNTLTDTFIQVKTYHEVRPRVQHFLQHLATYLGLLGLMTLLIGGIGVAESVRSLMRKRLETIATLKCLGASSQTILTIYLLQALILGAIGSLLGVMFGVAVQLTLPLFLASFFPLHPSIQLAPIAIAKGIGMGLITAVTFALWPLIEIQHVRPYVIFRRDVSASATPPITTFRSAFQLRWAPGCVVLLAVVGLTYSHTHSLALGSMFLGFVFAALTLLSLTAWLVTRVTSRLPKFRSLAWRQGLANLSRPGSQTLPIIVSIGLGVMVIMAISLIERDMVTHIGAYRPDTIPSFFFIDIQPDQKHTFLSEISSYIDTAIDPSLNEKSTATEIRPLIRSRITHIDGVPLLLDEIGQKEDSWYFTREYVLTFLDAFPEHNVLIRGQWWSNTHDGDTPLISIEEDVAEHLGVDVGSVIELDVQGTTVQGTVANVRRVNWNSLTTNFYMIFSPGSLDQTPMTYVGTVRVPPDAETSLQQRIIRALPNITAIRIREVLELAATVIQHMSLSIHFMALFTTIAGLVVLSGALAATRYQRLYDAAILKALGSTRGMIARTFAVEYAVTGASAGILGTALSVGLSWSVLRFMMGIPWTFHPITLLFGVAVTVGLTTAVGFLSTFQVLGQKPLPILREE